MSRANVFKSSVAFVLGVCFMGIAGCGSKTQKPEIQKVQATTWSTSMHELQVNLRELEAYLYDTKKFSDPANHIYIQTRIQKMADESKQLTHNPTLGHRDPTVRFVASRFSNDLQRANESFEEGKIPFARFQMIKVTSSCVLCHTRTQQGPELSLPGMESFVRDLPAVNQVEYLIASRRFDKAFEVLQTNLKVENKGLGILDMESLASLGMVVTVQFQNSAANALKIAKDIQNSSSFSPDFKSRAQDWKYSILKWQGEKHPPKSVSDWRAIFENRKNEIDAMRLIPGVLGEIARNPGSEFMGEWLLLLGESYEIVDQIFPVDLHENYYRACIQAKPHSEVAKNCFRRLSNSLMIGYTGTSGVHLPEEVDLDLKKLKQEAY